MRLTTLLAIACVCAIHAKKRFLGHYICNQAKCVYRPSINYRPPPPVYPELEEILSPSEVYTYWDGIEPYPIIETNRPSINEPVTFEWPEWYNFDRPRHPGSSSSKYGTPKSSAKIGREHIVPWKPPLYHQAYRNFDAAVNEVKRYFTDNAMSGKDKDKLNYIVIISVIDGLSETVAYNGWQPYDDLQEFQKLVKKLVKEATEHPKQAVKKLRCIIGEAYKRTHKLVKLMDDPFIMSVCSSQPDACDTVVYTAVGMSGDRELDNEVDLLISLGRASENFLNVYAQGFSNVTAQTNVNKFILDKKRQLRYLVKLDSVWRHKLFPIRNEGENQCIFL